MDVNDISERRRTNSHLRDAAPAAASAIMGPADRRRVRCADVARNRATRYARKHRIPKPPWPLIAALVLIGLIFERRAAPILLWPDRPGHGHDAKIGGPTAILSGSHDADEAAAPTDTGSQDSGDQELGCRPDARFLAKDVSQVVAFLIRNRGRLDNETVRMKWTILDHISLPLAIYLREVEANVAWDDLEKEISVAPFGAPVASGFEMPRSPRHRKILRLLPEWARRGEKLLSGRDAPDSEPAPTFDADRHERPEDELRKPSTGK